MSYITIGDERLDEDDIKRFRSITVGMTPASIWFYSLITGCFLLVSMMVIWAVWK